MATTVHQQLIQSVIMGDYHSVETLLQNPDIDINYPSEKERWTALAWAIMGGNENIVRLLLQSGANVEVVDANQRNLLNLAVIKNSLPILRLLLDFGVNIEQRSAGRETAFLTACRLQRYECMELLLTYGAYVDSTVMYNKTALVLAVQMGQLYTVEFLVQRGANISIFWMDQDRSTNVIQSPLQRFAHSPEIKAALLKYAV